MKRRASSKRAGQSSPRYRQWLQAKKPAPSLHIEALPAESFRAYFRKSRDLVSLPKERPAPEAGQYSRGWRTGYSTGVLVAVGWAVAAFYVLPRL